jgi:hypothetical protein
MKLRSKIKFVSSKDAYDSKKINHYISDEYGQMDLSGKVFKIGKVFYLYYKKYFFWFRFFDGYGIWGRSQKMKSFELFSERYEYTKYLKIFGWKLKILKPCKFLKK